MNIYNTIKAAITTRQAAEHFGLAVDKHGMALCPFHEDHQPSLKLDQRYYCFGCHATGDVIDFTARLHGSSNRAAAEKLAEIFGEFPRPPTQPHILKSDAELFREKEQFCICVLWDYLRLLRCWKLRYAPESPGDTYDDRFVEACQMLPSITAMTNILFLPDADLRTRLVQKVMQDNTIPRLKERLDKLREEEADDNKSTAAAA